MYNKSPVTVLDYCCTAVLGACSVGNIVCLVGKAVCIVDLASVLVDMGCLDIVGIGKGGVTGPALGLLVEYYPPSVTQIYAFL